MTFAKIEQWVRGNLLAIAAASTFVITLVLAVQDKTASATVMAGLFALTFLFSHFPNLETIKAWGIEAKFIRETLDEAKATLEQYRGLVELSSRHTFWALSREGRFAENDVRPKNTLASATMALMQASGLSEEAIERACRPYIEMMNDDFRASLRNAISNVIHVRYNDVEQEVKRLNLEGEKTNSVIGDNREAAALRHQRLRALVNRAAEEKLSVSDLGQLLRHSDAIELLTPKEHATLLHIFDKVSSLQEESQEKGYFTKEAESFLSEFGVYNPEGLLPLIEAYGGRG